MQKPNLLPARSTLAAATIFTAVMLLAVSNAQARRPILPEIRLSANNQVPVCVTPQRLMAFMRQRNHNKKLLRLYRDIAFYYKKHGEALKVRWDYAFFQAMIETNFLTYKTGRGRWGDVDPRQFNFAGIGTTGGGVPGNGFKDVSTGVKAQLEHLIAYSGEYQTHPTAPRTKLKQNDIIKLSRRLGRKVRFDDLSGRWAVDRRYARSIEWVAERFRKIYCRGKMLRIAQENARQEQRSQEAAKIKQAQQMAAYRARQIARENRLAKLKTAALAAHQQQLRQAKVKALPRQAISAGRRDDSGQRSALGAGAVIPFVPRPKPVRRCAVLQASYGGTETLLIKANSHAQVTFTALSVLAGFEKSMLTSYIRSRAPGGVVIGRFSSPADALRQAFILCPEKLARR